MAEDTPKPDAHPDHPTVGMTPVQARCLRCDHDLSDLPESARFCPRCGLDMLGSPPASMLPFQVDQHRRMSGLLGGWEHLFHIFHKSGGSEPTHAPTPDTTSLVVQGYGNALYRLGRRYELGSLANPREALRCYSKSARLGNFWAVARLASHVFATKSDASPDASDELPGLSGISPTPPPKPTDASVNPPAH